MNKTSKNSAMPPSVRAAAENLTPEFLVILAKLKLEVLIVQFQAQPGSPIWHHPNVELALESDLQAIRVGHFDASYYHSATWIHFYHVSDLGAAMIAIKAKLAALGLLEISTLLHAETAQNLRVWYPATAEEVIIGQDA